MRMMKTEKAKDKVLSAMEIELLVQVRMVEEEMNK
jgi:hypothetical protein